MGIFNFLSKQFIEIIEWLDDSRDTLVWRFDHANNEIKYGAKLIVRESQAAIFINEGQLADVYGPGTHTLVTQNMPILSTLKGWKYGFESPFKAEVYFVNTKTFTNWKWGTKNPITLRDPEIGPVRVRAFGTYSVRISDPAKFVKELVGTNNQFRAEDVADNLRNLIITRFTDIIGESKIPVLDMAGNVNEFSNYIKEKISHDFDQYGVEVVKVLVENISLPPEIEAMLDKRSSMGILGNLDQYTKFQAANAIEKAADNPAGGIAAGMGVGMGFGIGNQMVNSMASNTAPNNPPPVPPPLQFFVAINGQQQGPFNISQLAQMATNGQVNRNSLVWMQGMSNWTPAGQVQALNSIFAAVPPPLPPM
ncbi:MAG: SPFH domain-containing protein [Cytophagales bacterium]|nr:SPFH domain-containing protein [Bernardetiaceae bacterium]MDW8205778.1 SPFH domain-containing protein [Cytophagales bacterium]